jgi:hypothetical protein
MGLFSRIGVLGVPVSVQLIFHDVPSYVSFKSPLTTIRAQRPPSRKATLSPYTLQIRAATVMDCRRGGHDCSQGFVVFQLSKLEGTGGGVALL